MELKEAYKFKKIEKEFDSILSPERFTIIRVDGSKFHRYTKRFIRPFDVRIQYALVIAAEYVYEKFNRQFIGIYIQSDEASFILPDRENSKFEEKSFYGLPYNGRIQKIISLVSSRFTRKFNEIIFNIVNSPEGYEFLNKFNEGMIKKFKFKEPGICIEKNFAFAEFDARVFQVESVGDVKEYLQWRRVDAIRNSKNSFAQTYLSHKRLQNKSSNEQIKLVNEGVGLDYKNLPEIIKVGVPIIELDSINEFKNYFKKFGEYYNYLLDDFVF